MTEAAPRATNQKRMSSPEKKTDSPPMRIPWHYAVQVPRNSKLTIRLQESSEPAGLARKLHDKPDASALKRADKDAPTAFLD